MQELLKYLENKRDIHFVGDIKWAHAVNSIALLEKAISDKSIDFIEVDISLSANNEPIAAHYSNKSDLSFSQLLQILDGVDKGLKLDFKVKEAIILCLEKLHISSPPQPVILNADILNVQNAPTADIEPLWFINACQEYFPSSLLSLGWRTNTDSEYTDTDINAMLKLCKNLRNVTFPIRATLLPTSWAAVKKLIDDEGRTLTIWNSGPIDAALNDWILNHTTKQNCFYDFSISS
jgi:hypothetical protein